MVEIRPVADDELEQYLDAVRFGFGGDTDPADRAPEVLELTRRAHRLEAAWVAVDGREGMVATLGSRDFDLTVPGGGTVAMAGTTQVTVRPNHRRQGILTRLISRHLHQARDEGRPLVGLWASEEAIYGRFGYGHACPRLDLTLHGAEVDIPAGPPEVRIRYLATDEARTLLPVVYEQARTRVAGHLSRSPAWWELRTFHDPAHDRDGDSARRFALAERGGEPVGYVLYRQRYDAQRGGVPAGEVEVEELITSDDGARCSLWHLITHLDLYPRLRHHNCPVDEPVLAGVTRFRRLDALIRDSLWLRLVDVPAALTARRYESDGSLVLRVIDDAGLADGTWRLEVSCGQATCIPAGGGGIGNDADVTLGVAELGALYLGGIPARPLARIGRITGTDDAVRRLDALFRTMAAPHLADHF